MKTRPRFLAPEWLMLLIALLTAGCASTISTVFVNPEFGFGGVERVAVVPFENLSSDQGIGDYVTRVFLTELLAAKAFDIIEPGEVTHYLAAKGIAKSNEETIDQIKEMGKTLNVQAVIFGSIGESTPYRSGTQASHILSLNVRMVGVETGSTVWSAVVNTKGPGFFARMFGVGERTRSDAVRLAVEKAIKSLVK
jgi:polysaccharide biosynthesis protein PelC